MVLQYNLQLAIEKLTMHYLLPAVREHGLLDPKIAFTVSVPENGETPRLDINLTRFIEAGINLLDIQQNADSITASMLRQILSNQTLSSEGVLSSILT